MKKLLLVLTMALCFSLTYGQNCNPPRNLQGTTTKSKVSLNWARPVQSGDQEDLMWGSGVLSSGVGIGSNTIQFFALHKWVTTDISDYVGWNVIKISFIPYANGTFVLKAWGNTGSTPSGNGILTQNISSVTTRQWNTITLASPFTIEANKNYWFGYGVTAQSASEYPGGTDAGPAISGKGDIVGWQNQWSTLTQQNLSYNWCIKTTVQNAKGETKELYFVNGDRADVASYNIYRNGTKIGNTADTTYTDTGLALETTYHYCVEAIYSDGCISSQLCGDFTTQGQTCTPPQNVLATPYLKTVTVTWDRPYNPSSQEWLTWSGDATTNAVGTNAAADFYCAQRFTTTQLAAYAGYELTKVKFVPHEAATVCTYSIKVWKGGSGATNPGTLVLTQVVPAASIVVDNFVEVTLNTPVEITGTQDVWFGFECNTTGGYPGGTDEGPAVDEYGDLIYMGGWTTLYKINSSLNYNWCIQGLVESEGKSVELQHTTVADMDNTYGNIAELSAAYQSIFKRAPRDVKSPMDAVTKYNIYRNNTLIGHVDTATYQYVDSNLDDGTYSYCVTAVYDNGCESVKLCSDAEISSTCWPASNLTYSILAKKNVKLSWSEPADPNAPSTWITWSGEFNGNAIGTGNANDFYVAQRFIASDLTDYDGLQLVAIKFVPHVAGGDNGCTYTLRVWEGGNQSAPETLVCQQEVPATSIVVDAWNMVYLDTPITIDASKELWFGYECNTKTGYPAGTDAGPRIDYKGNMMYFGGKWTTMYAAGNNTLDYNWAIQGGLKTKDGKTYTISPIAENHTPATYEGKLSNVKFDYDPDKAVTADFSYYNVYRNNELIKTNLKNKTYTDMSVPDGNYVYGVTAVYVNGCESDPVQTESITISWQGINDVTAEVSVYPNPANNSVMINGKNITNIVVYNSLGQVIENITVNGNSKNVNTTNYKPGMYFFDVNTENNGTAKTKVVINH